MSGTMRLNTELARELTYENEITAGGDTYKVVRNEQIDSTRWTSVHELVIQLDDKFWVTTYERGLTESQDVIPFEYEDWVEFYQVYPYIVTTVEYRDTP